MARLILRIAASVAAVAAVTVVASRLVSFNATTVGFIYLLVVLIIASTWGFVEAAAASILATLTFNLFFLPPVGTLTIADPENWVALFAFLATSLIASRLSDLAKRRAQEAMARRDDVEHLYTFSRSILLIEGAESFPTQLAQALADAFVLEAVVLYDRRADLFFRGGPADFEGLDEQFREAARNGASFADTAQRRVITAVRLGSEPIAALGLQGAPMPDSVLQGIANLMAIGLERAKAQDLAHQVEAAQRSDHLRTTLLDAMSHEFKTPLTSIKAATTALLADPQQPLETRTELLSVADEEAEHLTNMIDDAVEMARLETDHIDLNLERVSLDNLVRDAAASLQSSIDDRKVSIKSDETLPLMPLDRRLLRLALKQILDNGLKYSPPSTAINIQLSQSGDSATIAITNRGAAIPPQEQARIFERFYRGPSTKYQIPGSGLGLSIANTIVSAHRGTLTVSSEPGETTFRITLPAGRDGAQK